MPLLAVVLRRQLDILAGRRTNRDPPHRDPRAGRSRGRRCGRNRGIARARCARAGSADGDLARLPRVGAERTHIRLEMRRASVGTAFFPGVERDRLADADGRAQRVLEIRWRGEPPVRSTSAESRRAARSVPAVRRVALEHSRLEPVFDAGSAHPDLGGGLGYAMQRAHQVDASRARSAGRRIAPARPACRSRAARRRA